MFFSTLAWLLSLNRLVRSIFVVEVTIAHCHCYRVLALASGLIFVITIVSPVLSYHGPPRLCCKQRQKNRRVPMHCLRGSFFGISGPWVLCSKSSGALSSERLKRDCQQHQSYLISIFCTFNYSVIYVCIRPEAL